MDGWKDVEYFAKTCGMQDILVRRLGGRDGHECMGVRRGVVVVRILARRGYCSHLMGILATIMVLRGSSLLWCRLRDVRK